MILHGIFTRFANNCNTLIGQMVKAKLENNTSDLTRHQNSFSNEVRDIINFNNNGWAHRNNYISIFRSQSNSKVYCYSVHDNDHNIIESQFKTIDGSSIVHQNDFQLVLGGPDYSDAAQTAFDIAGFLTGI